MHYYPWLDANVQRTQTLYSAVFTDDRVWIWAKNSAGLSAHTFGSGQLFWGDACQLFGCVFFKKVYPTAQSINLTKCHLYDAGIAAYKAMVSMVQIGYFGFSDELFSQMMVYLFEALFVTSGLVLGLSIPGLLFYRRRAIV